MTLAVPDSEAREIAQIRLSGEDWEALNGLTGKQRAFVFEYLKDLNATRAAERAGYAGNDSALAVRGSMLRRHPVVNPLIRKLTAATADELGLTSEYIMLQIEENAYAAALEGNHAAANAAWRTLAQLRGDMIERVDVTSRQLVVHVNGIEVEALK